MRLAEPPTIAAPNTYDSRTCESRYAGSGYLSALVER
jgi:hypothetical protein